MSEYIVEMRNITKRFPGIVANDDVTIQIKKGEVYALLGENGAGKSTLMSMLFGMYEPDEGEIYVRGNREIISSPSYAASLYIGMVHQHFKLVSNYTIAENIIMGIEPMKRFFGLFSCVDIASANKEIARLSSEYGLEVEPTKYICDLPVSVQQRVEILKMLYRDADILIFDEPTAVLTPQEIDFFLQIVEGLKEAGKTVILITHKLEEIKKVADRCAILNRGRLIDVLDVKHTTTAEMAGKMVGREVSSERKKAVARYGEEILYVQHLTVKDENKFDVVKNVSLAVRRGEIVAVAGVAGNGQVELADAIAGLKKVSSGKILLRGKEIANETVRGRIQSGISYIPEDRQSYGLVLDLPLCDNLVLKKYNQEPYARKGIRNQQEVHVFSERLQRNYDIRSARGNQTIVRSMSGGNQQKAIIARELEQDSSLIIFVQPTRGLDIGAIHNIHNQILAERDKGKAILLISLELDEIMALADTIAVMYNGQMLKCADATSLSVDEVGQYMMGVVKV